MGSKAASQRLECGVPGVVVQPAEQSSREARAADEGDSVVAVGALVHRLAHVGELDGLEPGRGEDATDVAGVGETEGPRSAGCGFR